MKITPKLSLGLLIASLAGLWCLRGGETETAASELLRPSAAFTHDNLSVFVLRGPETFDASNVLTLQEALESGVAIVHETGNVNQLAVENLSGDREVFLQSGDIVKGGRQDRLIAKDTLLPPKSGRVALAANCCEHSRWTGRGAECPTKFEKSTDCAVGNAIKIANGTGMQSEVWRNVEVSQMQLSANVGKSVTMNASPTSLQLALEDKDLTAKVAAYERALADAATIYPDAVGVVIAVNGQVIAAEQYGSNLLFRKLWPKLLKSAAVDAFAQMPKNGAIAKAPERADVEKFLASSATPNNESLAANTNEILPNTRAGPIQGNLGVVFNSTAIPRDHGIAANAEPQILVNAVPQTVTTGVVTFSNNGNFAGRSGATNLGLQDQTVRIAGGMLRPQMSLNQTENQTVAAAGIVILESQAASQPGKIIHRSILKK